MFENGKLLSPSDAKKKLDRRMQQMHQEACISALQKLAIAENNEILGNALNFYRKNKYLTPKFAFVVMWRLQSHHIHHNPSFFKINLKKDKYMADLREMTLSRVHVIWPAMTTSQRRIAIGFGHSAPLP